MKINQHHFLEGVQVQPTPNKGGNIKPRLIIVHDTAGGLDHRGSVSWLCNPQAKASAHFVVGRKGEVVQLAACVVKTWHAGKSSYNGKQNVNDFSLGIEIANPGKLTVAQGGQVARASFGATYNLKAFNVEFRETAHHGAGWWMPYTAAQLDAVLHIASAIRERYGIQECAAHWEISPGRKIDTGPQFPLEWLRGKLAGRAVGENLLQLEPLTPIRQWPSLFPENILTVTSEVMKGELLSGGGFYPAGQDLPLDWVDHPERKILWYKVAVGEYTGWVLATHAKML